MKLTFISLVLKNYINLARAPLISFLNTDVKKIFDFSKQKTQLIRKNSKGPFFCLKFLDKLLSVFIVFFIIFRLSDAHSVALENSKQSVTDESGILTKSSISYIEKSLAKIKEAKKTDVYFISVRNLPYKTEPQEYAKELFLKWELQQNDVVVVLVNKLAKAGIYKGDQVFELTDEAIQVICDSYIPKAKIEQYSSAALEVNNKLTSLLLGKKNSSEFSLDESTGSSNFKSAKKTEESRSKYIAIIAVLLVVAFVVPMIQFFYYVKDE